MLTDKDIIYLQNSPKREALASSGKYLLAICFFANFAMGIFHIVVSLKAASSLDMNASELLPILFNPNPQEQYSGTLLYISRNLMMGFCLVFGVSPLLGVILLLISRFKREKRIYQLLESNSLIEPAGSVGPR